MGISRQNNQKTAANKRFNKAFERKMRRKMSIIFDENYGGSAPYNQEIVQIGCVLGIDEEKKHYSHFYMRNLTGSAISGEHNKRGELIPHASKWTEISHEEAAEYYINKCYFPYKEWGMLKELSTLPNKDEFIKECIELHGEDTILAVNYRLEYAREKRRKQAKLRRERIKQEQEDQK